jgi:hypothetical protein
VIDSPNNTIARCGDLTPTPVIHRAKADAMRHFFQVRSRHVIGELRAWDNTSESDSIEAYMTPSAMIFGTWVGYCAVGLVLVDLLKRFVSPPIEEDFCFMIKVVAVE